MTSCTSLLVCCALLTSLACQDAGPDSAQCGNAKCDDPGQASIGQLMPRAPSTPGSVNITRNQGSWLFEVIGARGEIVLLSEDYADRDSARNGILSVEENGVLAEQYTVAQAGSGWSFTLKAGNNEVIADSQIFASESAAQAAAEEARDLVAGIVQYKAALATGAGFDLDRQGSSWRFELRDEDGQALLDSQAYSRRTDALTGIASVRNNGKDELRYELLDSPPRFILKAANGEEIAESSASYEDREAAEEAIASTQALLSSERVANPW